MSRKNNLFFWRSSQAFSLIEILLVLFIIAFLSGLAARIFTKKDGKVKSAFHKLVRLNNRLTLVSKLHNKEYRLAIQLNKEGAEKYWVEKKQPGAGPKNQDEEGSNPSPFFIDESFYSKPQTVPPLLQIVKAESSAWTKEKTEGMVYIYYHPKGLAQETSLYFVRPDNQAEWILYLDPITKELRILSS